MLDSLDGSEEVSDRALALLGPDGSLTTCETQRPRRSLLGQSADLFERLDDAESLTIALYLLAQEHDEPERFDRPIALAHIAQFRIHRAGRVAMKGEWSMQDAVAAGTWRAARASTEQSKPAAGRDSTRHSAGTLRAKAHAMLTANWLGETSHTWEEIDNVAADCEKIVRRAPGAWQLADILSVRCRNDLANGRLDSAGARTALLLEQAQLTDDPSAVSEAVLIAATTLATMNDPESPASSLQTQARFFTTYPAHSALLTHSIPTPNCTPTSQTTSSNHAPT